MLAEPKWSSERERDVARKREKSKSEKLVVISRCADLERRERLEADDVAWLMHYFGPDSESVDPFWYAFTTQQKTMIQTFGNAIKFSGDQAVAASRGEGKTTILERLITKYTMQGVLSYSVLFQSTGALADNSLDTIKTAIHENPLLAEDYPEVCEPVIALENTPNRAHYQVVSGFRHDTGEPYEMASSRFTWCGQEVIFPNVPGSPSAGAIIATRGLDSAVRGLKKRGRRPQLAAIDDPDTEETARSEEQAAKLASRIDKAIGGLGSQQKPIARILLTTIQSRTSVSFTYTDPQAKPSWRGKRFRYLVRPPDRTDLWEEYVALREEDWRDFASGESEDEHCRRSHAFYIDRREAMDAGADVANPNRYDPSELPDGSQVEVSSLQHYYNEVARLGQDAVSTEYDNDPAEDAGPIESGISAGRIQKQLSGYPRRVVPPDCVVLTRGIDVQKAGLHWVVKAWRSDATNYVIDYGFFETQGTTYGSDEGLEFAITRAIKGCLEQSIDDPYQTIDGEEKPIGLTLIDSGWQSPAVYQACAEIGLGVYPAKGHGKSHGCATPNFYEQSKRTKDRKPGDGWFMSRIKGGRWLVHCETDRWKAFEHERWMTAEGKPGCAYVFGEIGEEERRHIDKRLPRDAKEHFSFAKHLTAEIETEDVVRGKLVRVWKVKAGRVQNHYFDASYLSDVAGSILGVRLLGEAPTKRPPPTDRPSARDLARGAA